ncbi:uncharacterized protein LOC127006595 [Eriocheir sinensis]|uniref:uncharacterized protein LOC127006595 n=1 Tax=Eriocheir sinensis TaxID=95602 RepID=UPI0021C8BD6B|nr:uncharacterized protein LOC127006595 [Eriocheir sinensis]
MAGHPRLLGSPHTDLGAIEPPASRVSSPTRVACLPRAGRMQEVQDSQGVPAAMEPEGPSLSLVEGWQWQLFIPLGAAGQPGCSWSLKDLLYPLWRGGCSPH